MPTQNSMSGLAQCLAKIEREIGEELLDSFVAGDFTTALALSNSKEASKKALSSVRRRSHQ